MKCHVTARGRSHLELPDNLDSLNVFIIYLASKMYLLDIVRLKGYL